MSESEKDTPNYIQINGSWYEKISDNSVSVELDLSEDVLDEIDALVSSGKFVSRGDYIRTILRQKVDDVAGK